MQKQILETSRLVLREVSPDDLDFVAAMLADLEVMRYFPKYRTRDEAVAWVQRGYSAKRPLASHCRPCLHALP